MEAARDPHSITFEVDYWSALLDAIRTMNDLQRDAANALVEVPLALLELLLAPADKAAHEKAVAAGQAAMAAIVKMGEPTQTMLDLSHGRLMALREEAGLPPLPEEPFTPRRETRHCPVCQRTRTFTEGKCDYCAAPAGGA